MLEENKMSMLKRRIISIETRLVPEATIEDYLRTLSNEKNGIVVSEKEWKRIQASSVYKFIKSIESR